MHKDDVVHIEWIDSTVTYGWRAQEDDDLPSLIHSVGIIVNDLPKAVTISTSKGSTGNYCEKLTIPRCAIRRIRLISRSMIP